MDAKLKSHFINIYCMILADGKVDQKELNSMYEIGTRIYNVSPEEINKVLLSGEVVFYKPESEEDRILYLYDLACISVSDKVIPAAERMLLENYARKFDVEESQIPNLVELLIDCAKKNLSQSELLNELNNQQ